MKTHYDFVIIGAGPAGMAAALEAKKFHLSVIVLGEQWSPGGQVYRAVEQAGQEKAKILGPDYREGADLVRRFRGSGIDYLSGAMVWQIEHDLTVNFIIGGKAEQVRGARVLIATGARERPVPIPDWTLPGVMAATAADVLFKSHGIVPSGKVALAGSGPLLFLTATRLIASGVSVTAVLETTSLGHALAALPALPAAIRGYDYLLKGLAMIRQIRGSGTPIHRKVKGLEAVGRDNVEAVRFFSNGKPQEIAIDTLFLHNGVVPDTQITRQLEGDHEWNDLQRYWRPVADIWGNSSITGVGVAGDAAGISGARAAVASGSLAALEAAFRINIISRAERDIKAGPFKKLRARERSVRPFLDRLFRPDRDLLVPRDDRTVVCRCEEVTAGQIRTAVGRGASGPNQLKTHTRTGMGPCQGRMCELIVSEIIADCLHVDVSRVGYMRIRPPIKPITVKQLSEMTLIDSTPTFHPRAIKVSQ